MRAFRSAALLLAAVAVLGLGTAWLIQSAGVRLVRITSGSMEPTVPTGGWILVVPVKGPQRGDVVEFRYPSGTSGRAIKRVVAVGGDAVALTGDTLVVDGVPIALGGEPLPYPDAEMTIAPGYLYLLGDNHAGSFDSRGFGPIPAGEVVGRMLAPVPDPVALAAVLGGATLVVLLGPRVLQRRR